MFLIECSLIKCSLVQLTLSWRRPLSYRNQSIDFQCKSIEWFLYGNGLRHERVKKIHRLWKEINSLLSKEMPNSKKIYSSVRLPQISLNFWTSCCNLKTRGLGAILCVVFVWFLFWKEIWHFKVKGVMHFVKQKIWRNWKWKISHTILEINHVVQLVKEWQIKSKTVISWRSRTKKSAFFVMLISSERNFLTFVFYLNV